MLKNTKWKDKLLHIKLPHTYVLLTMILLAVVAMAYVIPSGQYDRVFDEAAKRTIVLPDSFHYVEGKQPGIFDIFLSVYRGYVSAANILFLVVGLQIIKGRNILSFSHLRKMKLFLLWHLR